MYAIDCCSRCEQAAHRWRALVWVARVFACVRVSRLAWLGSAFAVRNRVRSFRQVNRTRGTHAERGTAAACADMGADLIRRLVHVVDKLDLRYLVPAGEAPRSTACSPTHPAALRRSSSPFRKGGGAAVSKRQPTAEGLCRTRRASHAATLGSGARRRPPHVTAHLAAAPRGDSGLLWDYRGVRTEGAGANCATWGTQRQWLSSGADGSARAHLREALDLQHCAAVGVVLVLEGVRQALQQAVPRVPWPEVTRPSRQSPVCPNKAHVHSPRPHCARECLCEGGAASELWDRTIPKRRWPDSRQRRTISRYLRVRWSTSSSH